MKIFLALLFVFIFAGCRSGSVTIKTDSAVIIKGDTVILVPYDSTKKVNDTLK